MGLEIIYEKGFIGTDWYQKPTSINLTLNVDSNHCFSHKKGVFFLQ